MDYETLRKHASNLFEHVQTGFQTLQHLAHTWRTVNTMAEDENRDQPPTPPEGEDAIRHFFDQQDASDDMLDDLTPEERAHLRNEQRKESERERREAEARAEEAERTAAELENKLEQQRRKVAAYEEKFDEIKEPPLLAGHLLDFYKEEGKALVAAGDGVRIVNYDPDMIHPGDELSLIGLHPKSLFIVDIDRSRRAGAELGRVVELLDESPEEGLYTYTVAQDGGAEQTILFETTEDLEVGSRIKFNSRVSTVYQEIKDTHVDELVDDADIPDVTYEDIGGLDEEIDRIRDALQPDPDIAALFNRPASGDALLSGPPGCGKTMIAKATANEFNYAFFHLDVGSVLSKWVGESEQKIKETFEQAREKAFEDGYDGALIFIDEIDALATTRGVQDTAGVHKNIVAQILTEMDGINERRDVHVMAATNRLDMVDSALQRPGRFSQNIRIGRPDREAGEKIVDVYLDGLPLHEEVLSAFNGDLDQAYDAVKTKILDELFSDKYLQYDDVDGRPENAPAKRKDTVSGALIAEIVNELGALAEKRFKQTDVYEKLLTYQDAVHAENIEEAEELAAELEDAYGLEEDEDYTTAEAFLAYGEGIEMEDIPYIVERETREHALVEFGVQKKRQKELSQKQSHDNPEVM